MDKEFSYLYGLLQTDGNLYEQTRNRGRVRIELSKKDADIIYKLDKIVEYNTFISERKRTTNFGLLESISLSIYDFNFREKLKKLGFPLERKDELIKPPIKESFSEIDYVRGIIDGDGSLGITSNGFPFLSLVTKSDFIKDYYLDFLFDITGKKKNSSRNKRDNIYNISVYKEDAQEVAKIIYYDNCLAIGRKKEKAKEVLSWNRPLDMKKRN